RSYALPPAEAEPYRALVKSVLEEGAWRLKVPKGKARIKPSAFFGQVPNPGATEAISIRSEPGLKLKTESLAGDDETGTSGGFVGSKLTGREAVWVVAGGYFLFKLLMAFLENKL